MTCIYLFRYVKDSDVNGGRDVKDRGVNGCVFENVFLLLNKEQTIPSEFSHSNTFVTLLVLARFVSAQFSVYLGVRTCELFLCFAPFVFLGFIVLTSLFSLFYVTRECNRFLHRG